MPSGFNKNYGYGAPGVFVRPPGERIVIITILVVLLILALLGGGIGYRGGPYGPYAWGGGGLLLVVVVILLVLLLAGRLPY